MPRSDRNEVLRSRIETGIGLAAPLLDLGLAISDRLSRLLGSDDPDHVPARVRGDGEHAARGLRTRRPESAVR